MELAPLSHKEREDGEASQPHHVITVMEAAGKVSLAASMASKLNKHPKLLKKSAAGAPCGIFRVPESLVEINEKAYRPHIVSIGPYHHGKEHLKMMQEHKWRLLAALLAQNQERQNIGLGLHKLFQAIAPLEESIRHCYSEMIDVGSHELIEMMVLDGCFVIELFCIVGRLAPADRDDPIFNMPLILPFLMRDLLRLENQIPLFVVQTLFEQSVLISGKENVPSLADLTLGFFNHVAHRPIEVLNRYKDLVGKHLLDLFRLSFIPAASSEETQRDTSPFLWLIPSARNLHKAGIRFRPAGKDGSLLDIRFSKGVLEVPPLTIDDFSTSLFLNCVAFEQCYSHCSNHFTTYVIFMGCLVKKPCDAGFLCDHKIIENYFGTEEEVARFFNNVGKDVAFDIQRSYLLRLFEDVNEYYTNGWHVRWASFKHTYFETPWSCMSAFAALLLLIFSMIQAFFAMYAYTYPPKPKNHD